MLRKRPSGGQEESLGGGGGESKKRERDPLREAGFALYDLVRVGDDSDGPRPAKDSKIQPPAAEEVSVSKPQAPRRRRAPRQLPQRAERR